MGFMSFVLGMKEKYNSKNLCDEEVVKEINEDICGYLKEQKRGDLLVSIYNGIIADKKQITIAKDCGVGSSLVADYLVKTRKLIGYLEYYGISLKQFEKFRCRSFEFKEETLKKMDERRNIKRNR